MKVWDAQKILTKMTWLVDGSSRTMPRAHVGCSVSLWNNHRAHLQIPSQIPPCPFLGRRGASVGPLMQGSRPTQREFPGSLLLPISPFEGQDLVYRRQDSGSYLCWTLLPRGWEHTTVTHMIYSTYSPLHASVVCLPLSDSKICVCLELSHVDSFTTSHCWDVLSNPSPLFLELRAQVFLGVCDVRWSVFPVNSPLCWVPPFVSVTCKWKNLNWSDSRAGRKQSIPSLLLRWENGSPERGCQCDSTSQRADWIFIARPPPLHCNFCESQCNFWESQQGCEIPTSPTVKGSQWMLDGGRRGIWWERPREEAWNS